MNGRIASKILRWWSATHAGDVKPTTVTVRPYRWSTWKAAHHVRRFRGCRLKATQ